MNRYLDSSHQPADLQPSTEIRLSDFRLPDHRNPEKWVQLSRSIALSARSPGGPLVLEVNISNEQWSTMEAALPQHSSGRPITTPILADALRASRDRFQFQLSDRQQRALRSMAWEELCPTLVEERGSARLYGAVRALINHLWVKRSPAFLASPLVLQVRSEEGRLLVGELQDAERCIAPLRAEVRAVSVTAPTWVKQGTWEQCRSESAELIERFAIALQELSEGASFNRAGSRVGVHGVTLRSWCVRGHPPRLSELRSLQRAPVHDLRLCRLPRKESVEWAHLLGAYQAVTYWDGVPASVHFLSPQEAPVRAVHDAIARILSDVPVQFDRKTIKGRPRWVATVYSHAFSAALSRFTQGNSRLPWEVLGTEAERLAFLRGYFGFAGSVYQRGYLFFSTHHPEVVVGVAHLLDQFGVPVAVREWKHVRADVVHPYGLRRMRDLGLLLPHEVERLKSRIDAPEAARSPVERYETVLRLSQIRPALTNAQISRAAAVPAMTAHQWVNGCKVPREVVARRELRRFVELYDVPNIDTVSHLYRNHQMNVENAIQIGKRLTVHQVNAAIQELAGTGISVKNEHAVLIIRLGERYPAQGRGVAVR